MNNPNVLIPYDNFIKINEKAIKADAVLSILGTEFPDDTCQLIAIKSVLGYVDPEPEEPEDNPEEPSEEIEDGDATE